MSNTNCLEGFKCPACGSEERFSIEVTTTIDFDDDGALNSGGDTEWDNSSFCQCYDCDHSGTVAEFTKATA